MALEYMCLFIYLQTGIHLVLSSRRHSSASHLAIKVTLAVVVAVCLKPLGKEGRWREDLKRPNTSGHVMTF